MKYTKRKRTCREIGMGEAIDRERDSEYKEGVWRYNKRASEYNADAWRYDKRTSEHNAGAWR